MHYLKKGPGTFAFSLIELMVVIAIVALLVAVALPAYKSYQIQTRVVNSVSLLNPQLQSLSLYYQQYGTWPANITFLGATAGSGWATVTQGSTDIIALTYGASSDGLAATIGVELSTSLVGSNNTFAMIVRDVNGVIKFACGAAWYTGANVSYSYLPNTCQCANMSTFWSSATGC